MQSRILTNEDAIEKEHPVKVTLQLRGKYNHHKELVY